MAHSEARASVVMNRRIRNRTSGGVGGRRGGNPRLLPDCARQGVLSQGGKSPTGPTRGTVRCTARVPTARWDLKEAGGKALDRRTGSGYEATVRDEKANIFKVRNLYGTHGRRSDGHKCGRKCALPGEISDVAIKLAPPKGGDDDA